MPVRIALSLLVVAATAALVAGASLARGPRLRIDAAAAPVRLVSSGQLPDLSGASPGSSAASVLAVRNRGVRAGDLWLVLETRGDAGAARSFRLRVERAGRVLFDGTLTGARRLPVGRIAPGGRLRYGVSVSVSSHAGQALRATLSARWQAVAAA